MGRVTQPHLIRAFPVMVAVEGAEVEESLKKKNCLAGQNLGTVLKMA